MKGGFGERISDVKFSADGQSIVLVSGFGTLKVYDRSKVVNTGLFATGSDVGGVFDVVLRTPSAGTSIFSPDS